MKKLLTLPGSDLTIATDDIADISFVTNVNTQQRSVSVRFKTLITTSSGYSDPYILKFTDQVIIQFFTNLINTKNYFAIGEQTFFFDSIFSVRTNDLGTPQEATVIYFGNFENFRILSGTDSSVFLKEFNDYLTYLK